MGIMRSLKVTESRWLHLIARSYGMTITIKIAKVGETAKGIMPVGNFEVVTDHGISGGKI